MGSGCILATDSADAQTLISSWYRMRDKFGQEDRGVWKALKKIRQAFPDEVYFRDVQKDMGKPKSKVLATYSLFRSDVSETIQAAIQADKKLRDAANSDLKERGEFRAEL